MGSPKILMDFDYFTLKNTTFVLFSAPQANFLSFWHSKTKISFKFLDFFSKIWKMSLFLGSNLKKSRNLKKSLDETQNELDTIQFRNHLCARMFAAIFDLQTNVLSTL